MNLVYYCQTISVKRKNRAPALALLPYHQRQISAGAVTVSMKTARSDVIHIRELPQIRSRAQLRQGSIVEQVGNGVSRLDHDQANGAGRNVFAIGARPKSRDRGAGDGSKRAIKNPDDGADPDLVCGTGKRVTSASTLFRVDKPGVPQLGQDVIKEFFRDRIRFGDFGDLGDRAGFEPGEMDHRF
jgi:hypothetical protein